MMVSDWVIAISLTLFSSILTSVSLLLQKKSHNENQELPVNEQKKQFYGCICSKLWWFSLILGIIAWIPDMFSFNFASQSLLAPFAAVTLVCNQVLAPFVVNEKLSVKEIIASCIISGGIVMTTITGDKSEQELTLEKILENFRNEQFITFACISMIIGSYCYCKTKTNPRSCFAIIYYTIITGSLGGFQNVFLKCFITLFSITVFEGEESSWDTIYPYLFGISMLVLALSQLSFLNIGMARFDAVIFFPIYNAFYIIFSVVAGGLFFQEFKNTEPLFILGLIITIIGVLFMTIIQ